MRIWPAVFAIVFVLSSTSLLSQAHQHDSMDALRAGFHNPPPQARLRCYWWWLNGNTDKTTITRDLQEMKAKGYGGALLVDAGGALKNGKAVPAGPKFGSPAWTDLYTHALKEADRLGLEITLNIMSGWNLGGPSVKPEDASKLLTSASTTVHGGTAQKVSLPRPTQMEFYRQIAVLAYPLHHSAPAPHQGGARQDDRRSSADGRVARIYPGDLRFRAAAAESGFSMNDNSWQLEDGARKRSVEEQAFADARLSEVRVLPTSTANEVSVDLPEGEWEIFVVGYTNSGAKVSTSSDTWKGLAIDYLNKQAFNLYWDENVEPLLTAARPYKSLKYLATDSWELGGTNWTEGFREEFVARRGYDPLPYLPTISGRIIESRDTTIRFLTDLRRTVADLIVANHYGMFAERAKRYGLGIQAESGGPHGAPIDALETFRDSAVPQTEFWSQNPHRHADKERYFTKEAASAANIYGKRFVAQEGETSIGPQWSESLSADLKPSFDMAITEGMNRLVWHEFTSSPAAAGPLGQEYFAGTHLNPNVTWWNVSQPFFAYLNRVQFIMQQGHAVNDVLYFYGDHVPNFVRLKADDPAHVLPGYDYDVTNEDALLHNIRIEKKELVGPSGVRWKVLVLPPTRRVSIPVLQLVERYLRGGGTVISEAPQSTTGNMSPEQQRSFIELTERVWGGCTEGMHRVGTGSLYCTRNTHQALEQMKAIPDVELKAGDVQIAPNSANALDWVHREVDGKNIYFVRSAYSKETSFSLLFRARGDAEVWDPVSGEAYRASSSETDGRAKVDFELPPFGSLFVVFAAHSTAKEQPHLAKREPAGGDWSLTFPGQKPIHLPSLKSWTETGEGRYFSGTATYHARLAAPRVQPNQIACLHFTEIHEIAKYRLGDSDPSIMWTYPYQGCIQRISGSPLDVEIEVTNLWHNQLVKDTPEASPSSEEIVMKIDRSLLPSGLVGPAEWWIYTQGDLPACAAIRTKPTKAR